MEPQQPAAAVQPRADQLLVMGRYVLSAPLPFGTNGLGTCVGLAVQRTDETWFLAHISAAGRVQRQGSSSYNAAVSYVLGMLNALFPSVGIQSITTATSGRDFSTFAIADGITQWAATLSITPLAKTWSGLWIDTNNQLTTLGFGTPDATNRGDGEFEVPSYP